MRTALFGKLSGIGQNVGDDAVVGPELFILRFFGDVCRICPVADVVVGLRKLGRRFVLGASGFDRRSGAGRAAFFLGGRIVGAERGKLFLAFRDDGRRRKHVVEHESGT